MSIKPKFAQSIIDGSKLYEYRKCIPKHTDIDKVYIYVSKPFKAIIGEFSFTKVLCGTPQKIWSQTKDKGGISEEEFFNYFKGRDKAYAIKIGKVIKYFVSVNPNRIIKGFKAPQNFIYIDDNEELKWMSKRSKAIDKVNRKFLKELQELKKGNVGLVRLIMEKMERDTLGYYKIK